jgi:nucleoside permease NupC
MTVTWGILLQFGMGVVILRWPPGYAACKFLGDSVSQFLSYTDEGSKFVFGDPGYSMHPVAFVVTKSLLVTLLSIYKFTNIICGGGGGGGGGGVFLYEWVVWGGGI